jgi:Fur family ferric uptake transcriptional regulator
MENWVGAVAARHRFSDATHTVEIFGTCPKCRKMHKPV